MEGRAYRFRIHYRSVGRQRRDAPKDSNPIIGVWGAHGVTPLQISNSLLERGAPTE